MSAQSKRIEIKFTVSNEAEAQELTAAWHEIIAGKLARLTTTASDEN